jgi:diacylglycerol kinase
VKEPFVPPRRSWPGKFRDAAIGVWRGAAGQCSFAVHVPAAVLVVAAGAILQVSRIEWCLLALCIATVFSAELFNSALERIAKAIDRDYNEHLADGLNIASGAVLAAAIGAAVVGVLVLGSRFAEVVGWW